MHVLEKCPTTVPAKKLSRTTTTLLYGNKLPMFAVSKTATIVPQIDRSDKSSYQSRKRCALNQTSSGIGEWWALKRRWMWYQRQSSNSKVETLNSKYLQMVRERDNFNSCRFYVTRVDVSVKRMNLLYHFKNAVKYVVY